MADNSAATLVAFLQGHRLDQTVINFILADVSIGLGCESVSDFSGYFTQSECDFKGTILQHLEAFKEGGNAAKIQLSRLRVAWAAAVAATNQATESQPPVADPEAPLSQEEAKAQAAAWTAAGGFSFHASVEPAAHLVSRAYREFTKRQKGLDELSRMRSAENTPAINPELRRQLGDFAVITREGGARTLPTMPLDSVLQLLRAHKILTHLWAMTGTQRVTSKQDPSRQVLEAPYEDCLRYHTFVEAKIQEHPAYLAGDMATVIQWALDRDRRTRVAARALYNGMQFPWGEALAQAMKDNGVIWTVTEMGVTVLPTSAEEQGDQLPQPPQLAKGQPGQRGGKAQSK